MTSQRWQAEILAGVETIPHTGAVPGTLTLLNHRICAIIPGSNVWIAATEFGAGRVLVAAHEGYFNAFNSTNDQQNKHISQLHHNIKRWLTKGKFKSNHDIGVLGHLDKSTINQFKIIIWSGADNTRDVTDNDLISFVQNGGAIVHCMCSWGWLQLRPGKSLGEMPFKAFLDVVGIQYNNAAVHIPKEGIDVRHLVPSNLTFEKVSNMPLPDMSTMHLKDSTGEQWRSEILRGVHTIPHTGAVPGSIVLLGDSARPILSGSRNVNVWIGAAELGDGRILVVAHEGYLTDFNKGHSDVNIRTLHDNMKQWLTKNRFRRNSDIIYADSPRKELSPNGSILIWNGQKNTSFTSEEVLNFVISGGAFIHTMCPWGWMSLNPGCTLDDIPMYDILNVVGLSYTGRYVEIPNEGLDVCKCASDDACHLGRAIDAISIDGNNISVVGDAIELLAEIPESKLKVNSEKLGRLESIIQSSRVNYVPSEACPVRSKEGKALMGICELLCKTGKLTTKLPGINIFPGEITSSPDKMTLKLEMSSHIHDVHPTGYYVMPGESISITVLSSTCNQGWSVQIGAHTDCLKGQEQLKRWPDVICKQKLDQPCNVLHSTFGGLVYFISPDGQNSIVIQLENVVEAPFIDVTVPSSVSDWRRRRNAPGLWADVSGEFLTITLPSSSIRHLENPADVMRSWDKVLKAHFHLRGSDIRQHRRQWLVTDVQPSAGYMHSGYPVVTHLDIADPCHEFHLLNNDSLCSKGSWGVFHEFGHNMQRDVWTFPGTVEVTVNIFTLHAMDTITGQKPWIHSWLQNQVPNTRKYLNSNQDYNKWKSDPGVGLFIYAQIAHQFGWPVFKEIFRKYEGMNSSSHPTNEQSKIDLWYILLSDVCGHNLAPLVDFWKIPLSANAKGTMSRHTPFLPDDEIIKSAPDRMNMILSQYPNCLRRPTHFLPDNYNTQIDPPVIQVPRLRSTTVR